MILTITTLRNKFSITEEQAKLVQSQNPEYGTFVQTFLPFIQNMERCKENEEILTFLLKELKKDDSIRFGDTCRTSDLVAMIAISSALNQCFVHTAGLSHEGCNEVLRTFHEKLKELDCH